MAARTPQETEILTPAQAVAFVERHGIVCESARRSAIPSLADAIAGAAIRGNWWSHAHRKRIFALTRAVRSSPEVLVCRLIDGKVTFVHERLWPALVRVCERFPRERLARVHEVHGSDGKHRVEEWPFPDWVPADITRRAAALDARDARQMLDLGSA